MARSAWLITALLLAIAALEFAVLGAGTLGTSPVRATTLGGVQTAGVTPASTAQPVAPAVTPTPSEGSALSAAVSDASIAGTITNTLGTPIAGAQVAAYGDTGGSGFTTAAANGSYTITGLAPNSYRVQANATGYASRFYNETYDYSAATLVPAVSGNTVTGVDIQLAAGASITGAVTNALGTPIAGAQVNASRETCCSGGSAQTAANGTYVITDLAPGSYRVQAYADGFAGEYYDSTYDYAAATLVAISSGATTPGINFSLASAAKIAGTITNALGTPIAGAYVTASSEKCCFSGFATTAADGSYLVDNLSTGSYRLQAGATGYVTTYYNGTYDYAAATFVPATNGATTSNIGIALAVGGTITGTVVDALGTPVAGAQVTAESATCCSYGYATTIVDGTYAITDLAPGSYRVRASASGFVSEYYDNAGDYSAATSVPANSGGTTTGISFALAASATITGKVTNALGTPVAGAFVYATSDSYCCSGTTSGADGSYTIADLAPGSYRVQASASGYLLTYYNGTRDYEAATLVVTTSGNTVSAIDIPLITAGHISGTVTNVLGTPIADAQVSANSLGCCDSGYAQSAADGSYVIDVPAGSYRVQSYGPYCPPNPSPPCVAYAPEYYNDTYDASAATLVATTSGNTTPNINFALAVGGTISGKVVDPVGTPIAGAWVTASGLACCGGGFAITAIDGTYAMTGLPPGAAIVSAYVSGCAPPSSPPGPPCTPYPVWYYNGVCEYLKAATIPVSAGGTYANINVTLRPANPDCFDHAVQIGGLPFVDARSTAGSTTAPGETLPCGNAGATDWYQYTAPPSPPPASTVSVDTVGSSYNSAVAVYAQGISPPGILTLVDCKANASGSFLKFTADPGVHYYIQVGGQNGATGQLTLNVSPDTDGDGYTNIEESRLGKNPNAYCHIMRGDVDGDGAVSILDMTKVAQFFTAAIPPAPARYNQDSDAFISIFDLTLMAQLFTQRVTACT